MKKITFTISILLAVFSVAIYAGPDNRSHPSFVKASRETAIDFVDRYYKDLKKGMSFLSYGQYWTKKKSEELHKMTVQISEGSGRGYMLERQHILDGLRMEAACEKKSLISSSVYGMTVRQANIEYTFENLCLRSSKPKIRKVNLRYIKSTSQWVIQNISETGA